MNTKTYVLALAVIGLYTFTGCGNDADNSKENKEENQLGFDLSNIDSTVAPCEDFYHYAAGKWIEDNPVPSTESRWGSFNILFEENNKKLKTILEGVSKDPNHKKGSTEQLVGDFYKSAFDSNTVESLGYDPIKPDLERIEKISSKNELKQLIADNHMTNGQGVFGFYIGQDSKNSEAYISYMSQGGLGMPDRDYYLNEDERSVSVRNAYFDHLQKMFALIGLDGETALAKAEQVMDLETELAKISMTRTERRDVVKTYNKMNLTDLRDMTNFIDWPGFFSSIGADVKEVVVRQPDFIKGMDQLFQSKDLDTWKSYFTWHVLDQNASYLSSDFVNQNFEFFGKTLSGRKELKPRWKRSMSMVNGYLGQPLGKLFVKEHFPESAKEKVASMVENLRTAYRDRIGQLDWMSKATKAKAMEKLDAFNYKIGYPKEWKDYSGVDIQANKLVDNVRNLRRFNFNYNLDKLGKPVDKDEWFMNPQTVNAYYSPTKNEIVFPAGILQPPFYSESADDAINYGGIGAVIGHEFTHGFDDQGSKFDAHGNMSNWWTTDDSLRFVERTNIVVDQFNGYEVLDSVYVNGKLTLGENIADLGGLTLAYYAYQKSLEGKETPSEIDGFTHNQRFFLGWVNVWKNSITEEELRRRIITDPHSPGEYRVIGPLANMKEFEQAFGCESTASMMRAENERAVIW